MLGSRLLILARLAQEFRGQVRLLDISGTEYFLDKLNVDGNSLSDAYTESVSKNVEKKTVNDQLDCHKKSVENGSNVIRTFSEYISPPKFDKDKCREIIQDLSSTSYSYLQTLPQGGIRGLVGLVSESKNPPIEVMGTIGNVRKFKESPESETILEDYNYIIPTVAKNVDYLWIHNIDDIHLLKNVYNIAKKYKDSEDIYVSIPTSMLHELSHLYYFFFPQCDWSGIERENPETIVNHDKKDIEKYMLPKEEIGGLNEPPGGIVIEGRNWTDLNYGVASLQLFCEFAGGTKFGAIIQSEKLNKEKGQNEMSSVRNGMEKLWKKDVGVDENMDENTLNSWNDDVLAKTTKFWLNQGVDIIGCGWLNGISVMKQVYDEVQKKGA